MNLPEGKQTLSGHAWAGWRLRRGSWLQQGLMGSWEAETRESQPGDWGPHPSLHPKPAGTAELIASGCVLTPVKTDVHTVIPIHKGERKKKNKNQNNGPKISGRWGSYSRYKLLDVEKGTTTGKRCYHWKRTGFGDLLELKLSSAMAPTWRNREDALVFYFPVYF